VKDLFTADFGKADVQQYSSDSRLVAAIEFERLFAVGGRQDMVTMPRKHPFQKMKHKVVFHEEDRRVLAQVLGRSMAGYSGAS
jgi:hypothetical protein